MRAEGRGLSLERVYSYPRMCSHKADTRAKSTTNDDSFFFLFCFRIPFSCEQKPRYTSSLLSRNKYSLVKITPSWPVLFVTLGCFHQSPSPAAGVVFQEAGDDLGRFALLLFFAYVDG